MYAYVCICIPVVLQLKQCPVVCLKVVVPDWCMTRSCILMRMRSPERSADQSSACVVGDPEDDSGQDGRPYTIAP